MTTPDTRRVLGRRAVVAVLAAAVVAGVLGCLAVLRLGHHGPAAGDAAGPPQVTAPAVRPLRQTVAGRPVTAVAAGNRGGVVYGTEDGGVYVTPDHAGPRRLTGLDARVVKLAFDPGGRWLAAVSARDELAVLDTAHPAAPAIRRRIVTDSPLGVGIVPDQLAIDRTGTLVAAQTDEIGIYDLHGSPSPHWLAGTYECSGARDMAFAGAEFIAAFDSCANVWNASTLRMERQVHFPGTGNAMVGHHRILYGTFRHAMLLDYRRTSPLASADPAPGQPRPRLGDVIADKTISTRRSPIQPVADDGRVAALLQDARLIFWEPAAHRVPAVVALPFPAVCPSTAKPKAPAQFSTSFSPDHNTLVITGYCPPRSNIDAHTEEGRRQSTYRRWILTYPSP